MNLHDPAIQSALISAIGTLIAALVAAICAGVIGKQFADRQSLQEKLHLAQQDVAFLLAVETAHCQLHIETSGHSLKQKMRQAAQERGLFWSGKNTPGRVKHLELRNE